MNIELNLDDIKADMEIVGEIFMKFDDGMSVIYEKEIDVELSKSVQLESVLEDLEELWGGLYSLSEMIDGHHRGMYSILEAVRAECEKRKTV